MSNSSRLFISPKILWSNVFESSTTLNHKVEARSNYCLYKVSSIVKAKLITLKLHYSLYFLGWVYRLLLGLSFHVSLHYEKDHYHSYHHPIKFPRKRTSRSIMRRTWLENRQNYIFSWFGLQTITIVQRIF